MAAPPKRLAFVSVIISILLIFGYYKLHGSKDDSHSYEKLEPLPLSEMEAQPFLVVSPDNIGSMPLPSKIDAERILAIRPDNLGNMSQANPLLWKYIRTFHVFPPSTKPYNLADPKESDGIGYPAHHNSHFIIKGVLTLLKNKTNGVFVDVGAHNGEFMSNTLYLERNYGWTGLLIEGDPMTFPHLRRKQRKAWISDACLSPSSHPKLVEFQHADGYDIASRIETPTEVAKKWTAFEVQCFPLYSMLAAVNMVSVDYFSLDVEGIELNVLKALPWDKIFSVEHHLIPAEEQEAIKQFMKSKNYRLVDTITIDYLFAHSSILEYNTDSNGTKYM